VVIKIYRLNVVMLLPFGSHVHCVWRDPHVALHGIHQ